jgi:hypothetical protein
MNYEMIPVGMSLEQAEGIMGERAPAGVARKLAGNGVLYNVPGNFRWVGGDGLFNKPGNFRWLGCAHFCRPSCWFGRTHYIHLCLYVDPQNRVVGKELRVTHFDQQSVLLRTFYLLPWWSFLLAETVGLLIVIYLSLMWPKRFRRHSQLYTPALELPVFLSENVRLGVR